MKKNTKHFFYKYRNFSIFFIVLFFVNISIVFAENIVIPDIVIEIQSWLEQIWENKYKCKKEKCKINLNVEKIFSWTYQKKDYWCEWDFWYWTFKTKDTDKKCNPGYVDYSTGIFDCSIKVFEKNNQNNFKQKFFQIINWDFDFGYWENNSIESEINNWNSNENSNWNDSWWNSIIPKQNIILKEIKIQSWLKKDSSWKYFCDKEICNINLIYENDNKNLKCQWDFDSWLFTTKDTDKKCNPGYVKYKSGNYTIKLKIIDKNYNDNFKELSLSFSNIYKKQENQETNINENSTNSNNNEVTIKTIENNYNYSNLKLWDILPNPKGVDNLEYIEIINTWNSTINLKWCYLDDSLDSWSKPYFFSEDFFIFWNTKRKIYKTITKLNLNNSWDWVYLFCNQKLIDSIIWNYPIASDFVLNHKNNEISSGKAKVLYVIDWDTIVIELQNWEIEKLRLIWIDTPETKDRRKPVQFFWLQAYNFTKKELLGKEIYLEIERKNYRDKYSRLLWYVFLNWEDFNKKLLKNWYARLYDKFPFKYLNEYRNAEIYAENKKKWMWKFISPELKEKIFDYKYKKIIKQDEEYKKLEELLKDNLIILKQKQKEEKELNDLKEDIDNIFINNFFVEKNEKFWLPSDFINYKKANFLEKNIYNIISKFDKFKNLKEKYKNIDWKIYIFDEKKSIENYRNFVQKWFNLRVSKLKTGLKIYWKTIANAKVVLNIKNNSQKFLITLNSSNLWEFSYKFPLQKISVWNYEIKSEIIDKNNHKIFIDKRKEFNIWEDYYWNLKLYYAEKEYKNELKTLLYLQKDLTFLEKDFNKNLKKIVKLKEKIKKKKQKLKKRIKQYLSLKNQKFYKNKIKKVEIFEKQQNKEDKFPKNSIFYLFLLSILAFVLFFLAYKKGNNKFEKI